MLNKIFQAGTKAQNITSETLNILRLIRSENVGPKTFFHLINQFGDAKTALENIAQYSIRGGRTKAIKVCGEAEAKAEFAQVQKFGGHLISYRDKDYPPLLKHIHGFPPIISYIGNIKLLHDYRCVAIVGARNSSLNGKNFAQKIAKDLAQANIVTVSGLARGIDTAVHSAIPEMSVAIIAGGIDNIYPPENKKLYELIADRGLIISEQPFNTKPLSSFFPMRNRIISGVCLATAVIEANIKSGSLITARFAIEQNREVFAMPGFPMDPRSHGTNKLLKEGANVLESAEDIIELIQNPNLQENEKNSFDKFEEAFNNNYRGSSNFKQITIDEKDRNRVLQTLSHTPIDFEEVMNELDISIPKMHTICLELELAGKIIRHYGGKISLNLEYRPELD